MNPVNLIDISLPPVASSPWKKPCYALLRAQDFDFNLSMVDDDLGRLRRRAYEKHHSDFGQKFLTADFGTTFRFNGVRYCYRLCDYRTYLFYPAALRLSGKKRAKIFFKPDGDTLKYGYMVV